jgi:aldose 1-epimerase
MAEIVTFGTMPNGTEVHRITLANDVLSVSFLTFGATLQSVFLKGDTQNLTLGFDDLGSYLAPGNMVGCVIGPVANRIGGARAVFDGKELKFDPSSGGNTLHSGSDGWHNRVWDVVDSTERCVTFMLKDPDGLGGFPGNKTVTATYAIAGNRIELAIVVTSDARTPVAVTHHGYWNLTGSPTIDDHTLNVRADQYLTSEGSLPTGIAEVAGTEFDFRQPRLIGERSIDNNFCLSQQTCPMREVAVLCGGSKTLRLWSTDVGLQVYDGVALNIGAPTPRAALALEPQRWPDALNNPDYPTVTLEANGVTTQVMRLQFEKINSGN